MVYIEFYDSSFMNRKRFRIEGEIDARLLDEKGKPKNSVYASIINKKENSYYYAHTPKDYTVEGSK